MNKNQLQQGDVLLKRVSELPSNAKLMPPDKRGIVLANGEATGHHHRVKDRPRLELYSVDNLLFFRNATTAPVEIMHEEHKPFTIDPGIWQIGRIREHDYLTGMSAPVID